MTATGIDTTHDTDESRQRYPRRFYLYRSEDKTGISGTGVVADGVIWQDGTATIKWLGDHSSEVSWSRGLESVEAIHGHGGLTSIVYRDDEDGYPFHDQTSCPYDVSSKVKDLDLEPLD